LGELCEAEVVAVTPALPLIIQGGMGAGVSSWRLARAVSRLGQLGVVSGVALDSIMVRRLQDGDPGGYVRAALERFPIPQAAAEALRRYYRRAGRVPGVPYTLLPVCRQVVGLARQRVAMLAAFVEVSLAKEGHAQPVGMNLLTKIQLPTLASLYGAMLGGVSYVLMGAGIPREIPGVLDRLAEHQSVAIRFDVTGLPDGRVEYLRFDPGDHWDGAPPPALQRPRFLPIVASNSLATVLARKATGRIDGLVIEGPTAGGHNAPPRGPVRLNAEGEPEYGARDEVDLARIRELGLPFWIAGGAGHPDRLRDARSAGAAGIQVGTLFAYCDESGMAEPLKRSVLAHAARGAVSVRTDPSASPTGYPFKVVTWTADPGAGVSRERVCDLGYLREAYATPEGTIGYRCAAEPEEAYVWKGGRREDTVGRRCLCNGLLATIGQGQLRAGGAVEPPIVTSGDDLRSISGFLAGRSNYTARDVIEYLLEAPLQGGHG
jgi:NAD(P)H-dependent flavin oxidoreductase YrpB (nitropropane dioxygenase family)